MPRVFTSTKFQKRFKKQTAAIKEIAREQEKIFLKDPYHPRLGTHKLKGKNQEHWAYWVTREIRIKFLFITSEIVMYVDIGTHDEVY